MNFLYVFILFLNCCALLPFSNAETRKLRSSSNEKPLVLQWKVSHPRNTDHISLIFRQNSVELVTNTSSYQAGKIVHLGRFESPLNAKLKELKDQVNRYYNQLKKTVPLSSLIKDSRLRPSIDPHAPVLYINEEEIKNEQAYFKPLANIIYTVWKHKWTCIECASYSKERKSVVRTVKKIKSEPKSKKGGEKKERSEVKKQWKKDKQKFSKKLLNCLPKGEKIECIDPQFGIFEI